MTPFVMWGQGFGFSLTKYPHIHDTTLQVSDRGCLSQSWHNIYHGINKLNKLKFKHAVTRSVYIMIYNRSS